MTPPTLALLPNLPPNDREKLFENLDYLNLEELHGFCRRHGIPFRIGLAASGAGTVRATSHTDRKPVVLERVRHYLETSQVLPATVLLPPPSGRGSSRQRRRRSTRSASSPTTSTTRE